MEKLGKEQKHNGNTMSCYKFVRVVKLSSEKFVQFLRVKVSKIGDRSLAS